MSVCWVENGIECPRNEPETKKQKLSEACDSVDNVNEGCRGIDKDASVHSEASEGSVRDLKANSTIEELRLKSEIKMKEEKLRKLKLVKMYRSKNNLDELDELVSKWRTASQLAAHELCNHMGTEGKRPTVRELLTHFQIDHDVIGYSEEDDEFVEQ
jgi:hypothetical protein